jgi:hypothetical protein
MPELDASSKPQDPTTLPGGAAARSRDDGGSTTSRRAWFPPEADDFEITPEAAMYAGRR